MRTYKQTNNKTREDARSKTHAPFLLRIVRKGKREYKDPQGHKNKQSGQREQRKTTRAEQEQKDKKESKRTKTGANTPQVIKPPNYSRVQKPHKPRKDLNPYKYTPAPPNRAKNALKTRNKAYFACIAGKQGSETDKRRGINPFLLTLAK